MKKPKIDYHTKKVDLYKQDVQFNYCLNEEDAQKSPLERIVEKAAAIAFSLGFLFLSYGAIFGSNEVKEQIAQALKTTLYFSPNGSAIDTQIFTETADPSVRKWLDYFNKNHNK